MKRLENLPQIAQRQLGGLEATPVILAKAKLEAAERKSAHRPEQRKFFNGKLHCDHISRDRREEGKQKDTKGIKEHPLGGGLDGDDVADRGIRRIERLDPDRPLTADTAVRRGTARAGGIAHYFDRCVILHDLYDPSALCHGFLLSLG